MCPLIVFLVILFAVKNLVFVTGMAINRNSYILFHLNSSYDDRMSYHWGIFYKFMVFVKNNKGKTRKVIVIKQKGKGKADAVWFGLKKATGEVLMIYDADRTVPPTDLPKFYNALASNSKDRVFINGDRLSYSMEKGAMQTLNKIGNHFFSFLFTHILGQHFTDTLCGTKVFWRQDFKKFRKSKTDPFGDFDLIFGAIRNKLKVIEVPVRYRERVYGTTNINRFYHGLLLFKMVYLAYKEFYKSKPS